MRIEPITVRESAYYVLLPDVTRIFLGQSNDRHVTAQAADQSFFILAKNRYHLYSVCFWPDHVSLHAERRQATLRSRFWSKRITLEYADPGLSDKVVSILVSWLRAHRRYYQKLDKRARTC